MKSIGIVITTYESPEWLEKVLWGYSAQRFRDFEVIIADDGSSPMTEGLIEQMRIETGMRIRHVWHEHHGFRKCRILNRAIHESDADYLIFTDGDCIPRSDFVQVHYEYAREGHFLSGGIVRLPRGMSHEVQRQEILDGSLFRIRRLLLGGVPLSLKLRLMTRSRMAGRLLERMSTTKPTFNGYNSSAWKSDLLSVNGFDERMQYGGLDRELGERLVRFGVKPISIRHKTVVLHLDHDRSYRRSDLMAANRRLRDQNQIHWTTWTDYGLRQESRQHAA
jgi:glycosyltransferase involved in cell wall biosynthesis